MGGVRLRAVTAGPRDGPPVVLLHGFPDYWRGWRHQIGPLAAAGFRVIAPDQRGYNLSSKPPRVKDYALDILGRDIVAVIDALGVGRAAVVGHDWGGIVAWWLGLAHPDRVSRLVVSNAPHPRAWQDVVEGKFEQLARSWYVFAAQVPGLPEAVARATGHGFLSQAMRRTARPGTFTERDLARYRRAWARPGAVTGMVNWYRALVRHRPEPPAGWRVRVPTLLLWGVRDAFLTPAIADASAALCDAVEVVRFPHATHWLPVEEPARVNERLVGFLGGEAPPRPAGTGIA
ncbi:MAG: alpha/beta hydrolase [Gemmataceae bacterium]|nr:alpha/beta hydrolase [Gemmataceae bacterium]